MIAWRTAVESLSANCASSLGAPNTSRSPGSPRISWRLSTGNLACAARRLDTPGATLAVGGRQRPDGDHAPTGNVLPQSGVERRLGERVAALARGTTQQEREADPLDQAKHGAPPLSVQREG